MNSSSGDILEKAMAEHAALLTLSVKAGRDADDQENAELTRGLRQYFLDRDIDKVEFARAESLPPGAKGDPVTLATLAITLAPVALTGLLGMLQSWLTRHERATVILERAGEKLTLTGTPSREQQQTLAAFLDRHKS
jgi:hypothetical protein